MKILLTNDDGIESSRLHIAENALLKLGHKVHVVAPKYEQSAKSMAMTTHGVDYEKIDDLHYAVLGTPVDCVNFALQGLNLVPDFVISGINNGFNLGIDIYYSGTVGAAFQAQYHEYPSIAFSADYRFDGDLSAVFTKTLMNIIADNLLDKAYVININFPPNIVGESYVETTPVSFKSALEGTLTDNHFSYRRHIIDQPLAADTDYFNYLNGRITLSKLALRLKDQRS